MKAKESKRNIQTSESLHLEVIFISFMICSIDSNKIRGSFQETGTMELYGGMKGGKGKKK